MTKAKKILAEQPIKTVELHNPIGDLDVIELREPTVGALRGLNGLDLVKIEYTQIGILFERIAINATKEHWLKLSLPDRFKVAQEIATFFVPPESL